MSESPDYSYDPNSGSAPQPGGFGHPGVSQAENPSEGLPAGDAAQVEPDPNPAATSDSEPRETEVTEGAEGDVNQLLSDPGAGAGETPNEFDNAPAEDGGNEPEPTEGAQTEVNQILSDAGAGDQSTDYSELLEKNLPEIEQYVEEHPEEKDAIIAAEEQREKPRKGVLGL